MQEMNDFIDASLPKIQAFMTLVSVQHLAAIVPETFFCNEILVKRMLELEPP